MPGPRTTPPLTSDDLLGMRQKLITQMASGNASIETPLLGRVEFSSVADIQAALAYLDAQLAAMAGAGRTFVAQSNRGTNSGGCCS